MKKRYNIALIVGDIRDLYSNCVTKGAMRAARETDSNILIVPGRYFQAKKELLYEEYEYQYQTLFSYFTENNVDIVIACTSVVGIVSGSMSRNSLNDFLARMKDIPVITVSGDSGKLPNICYDNKAGIKEGMDIMISKQKCTKIAMVAGPKENLDSIERVKAYKESLAEHEMPVEDRLIIHCDFTEKCMFDVINLFKSVRGIDGVVFANDRMAIGGYEAMRELGLRVGRDVSFMGFDNIEKDINLDPPLASVVADAENIGYESVKMALDYLNFNDDEDRVIPTHFVMRESIALGNKDTVDEQPQQFKITQDTDFDTFAKQSFLFIYNPTVNNANRDNIYRAYLFFVLEIEKLYRNDRVKKDLLTSLAQYFNKLFDIDERCEVDIGKFTILMEMIKESVMENAQTKEKKAIIVNISAYVYRRLASILSLRESDENYKLKKIQHEIYRISADMIGFDGVSEKNYASIISNFHKIGINYSFLYLFKDPIKHSIEDNFEPDEFIYLKAMQIGEKVVSLSDREQMTPVSEMFEFAFNKMENSGHLVMLNLYVRDMIYGVLVCDIPYNIFAYYESLIYQVSCAIRILHLLMFTEETSNQLKESLEIITKNNLRLDTLAKQDELTGIYNRRGFFIEAENLLKEEGEKSKYIIVGFADTDNLKIVNDTYGHDEGDFIIISSSEVLSDTLGNRGIIARMGGDEFAFVFNTNDRDEDKTFFDKFEDNIRKFNEESEKEYKLSISLGMYVYEYNENINLKELLESADKEMYHIKKNRRNKP
ncbi:MAG: GGDEF domain-containing protein [Lachnospiraceae bacterium]|nr:GGDEF domain-containing protein [Lachnospiraceae bacterium]